LSLLELLELVDDDELLSLLEMLPSLLDELLSERDDELWSLRDERES
jgi:hypothetical protein